MAYLDIPREFFINACERIQYSPSKGKNRNILYCDISNKYVLMDGLRRNNGGGTTMFGCVGFDDKNKDIIEFCYQFLKEKSFMYHDPDCRYGFDGENKLINTKCQLKELD